MLQELEYQSHTVPGNVDTVDARHFKKDHGLLMVFWLIFLIICSHQFVFLSIRCAGSEQHPSSITRT